MAKSKKEKIIVDELLTMNDKQLINKENVDSTTQLYFNPTDILMPELEELVKKNPNRLIGCGG